MWGAKNKFLSFCLRRKTFSSLHITFQGPPFSVSCARGKKKPSLSPRPLLSARYRERKRTKSAKSTAGESGGGFFTRTLPRYGFHQLPVHVSLLRETKTDFNRCSSNSLLYFPSPCCDSFGNSHFSTAFYPTVSPPEDTEREDFLLLSLFLFPPEGES